MKNMKKWFLLIVLATLVACGGDGSSDPCAIDSDGDGYMTGSDCSALDPEKIDCDDSSSYLWSIKGEDDHSCQKSCLDSDQDGYFSQCDHYPDDKIDCDDSNKNAWTLKDGTCAHPCSDNDKDGYYFDCEADYPDGKQDCYDNNSNLWSIKPGTEKCLYSCVDRDKDGYFSGCDNYPHDKIDCDDDDPLSFTPMSKIDLTCKNRCIDQDQDGHFIECDVFDQYHPEDACDSDAANWESAQCRFIGHGTTPNPETTCVDNDGDGYYSLCNRYTEQIKGPDCSDTADDPFSFDNWSSCSTCIDSDQDNYYVGCDRFSAKTTDQFGLMEDFNDNQTNLEQYDLLIIVNDELKGKLDQEFTTYKALYPNTAISIYYFKPTTHQELRALIKSEYQNKGIKGIWLVGDLPTAWYEMDIRYDPNDPYDHEVFPFDYYYTDLENQWFDTDHNGVFDSYSKSRVTLSIFSSHLLGTLDEMKSYFVKLKQYHETGSLIDPSVFVFIDDDWQYTGNYTNKYALTNNYASSDFTWYSNKENTTQAKYLERMSGDGAEFVYQWIHSDPTSLYFNDNFGDDILHIDTMANAGIKGSFFNLFDCSAARFTETNMGTFYIHQPYGLATIGSAKTGALLDATYFHRGLGNGKSWGEAYRYWYNIYGYSNNDWHMTIVIQGDPLITLSQLSRKKLNTALIPPITPEYKAMMNRSIKKYQKYDIKLGTFEEYKTQNPQFFKKR